MNKVRIEIELDRSGIKKLLHSKSLAASLKACADRAAEGLGDGYKTDYKHLGSRVIASVYAASQTARRDNSENNSIIKAVLASRDR